MITYEIMLSVQSISFLFLNFIIPDHPVFTNVGGHALFASLSQLEDLWYDDMRTVHVILELLKQSEGPPESLKS